MKTLVLAALAAATFGSAAAACEGINSVAAAADNYVQRDMIWDEAAQKTRPTLIVAVNGTVTRYEVGQMGLSRDTIMARDGYNATDWVKANLGHNVKHLTYSSDCFDG